MVSEEEIFENSCRITTALWHDVEAAISKHGPKLIQVLKGEPRRVYIQAVATALIGSLWHVIQAQIKAGATVDDGIHALEYILQEAVKDVKTAAYTAPEVSH
jgi:hypothetical protein